MTPGRQAWIQVCRLLVEYGVITQDDVEEEGETLTEEMEAKRYKAAKIMGAIRHYGEACVKQEMEYRDG